MGYTLEAKDRHIFYKFFLSIDFWFIIMIFYACLYTHVTHILLTIKSFAKIFKKTHMKLTRLLYKINATFPIKASL